MEKFENRLPDTIGGVVVFTSCRFPVQSEHTRYANGPPSLCDQMLRAFSSVSTDQRCKIPGVPQSEILFSELPYIPPGWSVLVELVLVFIIARKLLIERKMQLTYLKPLRVVYFSVPVCTFGLVMCLLEVVDCAVFVAYRPHVRLCFVARTGGGKGAGRREP